MHEKILVIGELIDGVLRNVTFEAIGAASRMNPKAEIIGLICGKGHLENQAQQMIYYGADRVIIIVNDHLDTYTSEGFGQALMSVITEEMPNGIVMGHTAIGKDLTPKLASRLNNGLISDVIHIARDGNDLVFTRPIYSGKAFERKKMRSNIQFVTVRPNNIPMPKKDDTRTGEIVPKEIEITPLKTIIKEVIRKTSEGIDMSEAKVIIAGGRGVKSAEGFKPLYELAELLGGAVGASRGACDAGYCDYSLQIGQTGKIVTPDLYIAVGISGAIQHLAGMSHAKVIVAINKDPDASIFNISDYGIVGDQFEVIPLLIDALKEEICPS